ncbi:Retrovirus-related Pol polyprotein from transposon 297 [Araneus ventricosus]|uniref:RNA-directed DNA polymerase n=1 Tax=Araneus ventricosus TaxID=182803 RepID=A0A4Y2GZQ1_ARAVE|nr:Retrovirus-related Pol polyprotein from transposon 297 [Araneus ventricosus]
MTRSQTKRSTEKDQNKEAEMEQSEEMTHFEIDEEILPQADEEFKEIKQLVEVDSKVFIESQHQSRDLAPLLNEAKTENSSKLNDFKIKENGMLVKRKIDKNGNEIELIAVPEKNRDQIMSKIKDAGLTIKPIKCKFAQGRVKYLGHIVGRGITTANEVKIKAVLYYPVPTTKSQVRAFLGLSGYYNQYIPMFSSIVASLTEALKGKLRQGKINWTEECTRAFKELKDKLSQQPILYAPDFNKEFILQTDASNSGMGVILAQKDDNDKEHPVLYLSKKFSETEKKYSTTERECAAIIFAVRKLQCYLDGHTKFLIMTDHNPLVWLKNNVSLNHDL